jgi:nucleoside-diphosphate-sugar epimerase
MCNLVYADDTVQVIMQALQEPAVEGRVFNLCAPKPPTWNEYFAHYAQALRVPLPKVSSMMLALETKLLAAPLKVTQLLAGKLGIQTPDPMPSALLRLFGQKILLRNAAIEQFLRPKWMPLEEGLARAAAWLKGQGAVMAVRRATVTGKRVVPGR